MLPTHPFNAAAAAKATDASFWCYRCRLNLSTHPIFDVAAVAATKSVDVSSFWSRRRCRLFDGAAASAGAANASFWHRCCRQSRRCIHSMLLPPPKPQMHPIFDAIAVAAAKVVNTSSFWSRHHCHQCSQCIISMQLTRLLFECATAAIAIDTSTFRSPQSCRRLWLIHFLTRLMLHTHPLFIATNADTQATKAATASHQWWATVFCTPRSLLPNCEVHFFKKIVHHALTVTGDVSLSCLETINALDAVRYIWYVFSFHQVCQSIFVSLFTPAIFLTFFPFLLSYSSEQGRRDNLLKKTLQPPPPMFEVILLEMVYN